MSRDNKTLPSQPAGQSSDQVNDQDNKRTNERTNAQSSNRTFVGRWSQRKLQSQSEKNKIKESARQGESKDDEPTPGLTVQPERLNESIQNHEEGDKKNANHTLAASSTVLDTDLDTALPDTPLHIASQSHQGADEEPLLTDADMPDIRSLNATSDVSAFFNRGVSVALRKAALKHVFSLPIYNIRDGLNDYDEDYTVWEPLGDTVTCDMKFHEKRRERERLERERLEAEAEAETETETETAESTVELAATESDAPSAIEQQQHSESLPNGEDLQLEIAARLPTQHPDRQAVLQTRQQADQQTDQLVDQQTDQQIEQQPVQQKCDDASAKPSLNRSTTEKA